MKRLLIAAMLVIGFVGPVTVNPCGSGAAIAQVGAKGCCKICSKGKACGNSCIARDKTCHKGSGCACNG